MDRSWGGALFVLLVVVVARNPTTAALVRTTAATTIFQAGTKENVIPHQATVNLRLLPGGTVEAALAMCVVFFTQLIEEAA
ncbi:peptidase dimerization domain-containing protein [Candidatus Bipolaricaulota bacterium]|nr:peptidase dimerization domain-containing protein [Candidatus Bipolaricaulota bacterium]